MMTWGVDILGFEPIGGTSQIRKGRVALVGEPPPAVRAGCDK